MIQYSLILSNKRAQMSSSFCERNYYENSELVPVLSTNHNNLNHYHYHHHLCHPQMELRLMTVVLMAIMTMTTLLALCITETEARPSRSTAILGEGGWPEYMSVFHRGVDQHRRNVNECDNSSEVREMCQRCAKATKSKWAYPLCCENKENMRRFCRNFLNFGISPNDVVNS